MIQYSIFLIDDEESIRQGISFNLKNDYALELFADAESAIKAIQLKTPDLVLLDIGLPGMDGIQALARIKEIDPRILVIMITGFEDIETVISAMKLGAYDYIVKPLQLDALRHSIANALETVRLKKEVQELKSAAIRENMPCIIGDSNAIQDVMQFIEKAASSPDTPILITGESGTGKELIASAVHHLSPNFQGPFVTLNCAAIPNELVESELFGYEKGAFSGAQLSGKSGLLEAANGGTLFLDEIADLSAEAQAKMLRWLEDGKYYRVGGTKEYQSNVRIVSATNKDLEVLIKEKLFRLDLYYRIGVITVQIPSLNERRDDIVPIAEFFLSQFSQKFNKPFTTISPELQAYLQEYQWKGNVRELKNHVERAVLMGAPPELTLEDLQLPGSIPTASADRCQDQKEGIFPPLPPTGLHLEKMERYYLQEALEMSQGNDAKAAQLLGLSYYAFRYRRKKLEKSEEINE